MMRLVEADVHYNGGSGSGIADSNMATKGIKN